MKRRILIVEDEEDIREVLRDFFESEGCRVSTAVHGKEALQTMKEGGRPDLILLDLMMPVMSGEEFIAKKNESGEWSQVPVVIMSADHQVAQKAAALNVKWFIPKPLTLGSLISSVTEALRA